MARIARRRAGRTFKGHAEPARIRFHGQELEFSEELKYLVADEAATSILGESPTVRGHDDDVTVWKRTITRALNLFEDADRGLEGYEWLVTPNAGLGDERPLGMIKRGAGNDVLRETERYLRTD